MTSNPLYLWIYLFFMNFVWVGYPIGHPTNHALPCRRFCVGAHKGPEYLVPPRQVIIPGILLVDSWRIMVAACDKAKARIPTRSMKQNLCHVGCCLPLVGGCAPPIINPPLSPSKQVGTTKKGSSSIPVVWYHVVLGTLALYAVLVPFICGLIAIGKL